MDVCVCMDGWMYVSGAAHISAEVTVVNTPPVVEAIEMMSADGDEELNSATDALCNVTRITDADGVTNPDLPHLITLRV